MTFVRRYLGIDYGSKRIGLAISDPLNIVARTLTTVLHSENALEKIKNIVNEYLIGCIVIGMPLTLKGEKGKQAQEVEKFIGLLEKEIRCPVVRWDERFTSKRVHQTFHELNVRKKHRENKSNIDKMAAAFILQSYLDSRK
jgi:putative Holliday junction resolvase